MSGLSLAAGPRAKPPGLMEAEKAHHDPNVQSIGGLMGSVSFLQVQMLAYITVFTVSGLVPISEMGFVVFTSIYIIVMSTSVFRTPKNQSNEPLFRGHRFLQLYIVGGTVLGLFLPLGYVFGGFTRGDQSAVAAATPHLFLMSCQLLTESLISDTAFVSLPLRALVPIFYNVRRLVSIGIWLRKVFAPDAPVGPWTTFGRILAVGNAVFWAFNLFVFLVPVFLPMAFERYFAAKNNWTTSGATGTQTNTNTIPPAQNVSSGGAEETLDTLEKKSS